MIRENLPGAVVARAVIILIESIRIGIGIGIGKEKGTEIGIEKENGTGTGIEKGIGTMIGIERDTGIGAERGIESGIGIGIGTGKGTESGVMIMIGGPNMQKKKAGGTMRGAAAMVVGIIIVGVEVGAEAEVGACKLALEMMIGIRVHKETGSRRRHLCLIIWQNLRISMVI